VDSTISIEADLLPKHRTQRVEGPSRLRADAKDIMELWGALDAAQYLRRRFSQANSANLFFECGRLCAFSKYAGDKGSAERADRRTVMVG